MTTDWKSARLTLQSWAADLSGVPVDWWQLARNQHRGPQGKQHGVQLQLRQLDETSVGPGEERKTVDLSAANGSEVMFSNVEQTIYRLQIEGDSVPSSQEKTALPALQLLRARLISRASRATLKAIGFAINRVEPIRTVDSVRDGRRRPKYVLEIAFNVSACTEIESVGFIDKMSIEAEYTTPGGSTRSTTYSATLG